MIERSLSLTDYQRAAVLTSRPTLTEPGGATPAAFGLIQAAGSIARLYKKLLYENIDLDAHKQALAVELGDALWYTAAVAKANGLDLDEIAKKNLSITQARFGDRDLAALRNFDDGYDPTEQFPRQLVLRFHESSEAGVKKASMTLVDATPNVFPDGPVLRPGNKMQGFRVGNKLGDTTDDNSRRVDGYRFHDAIHLGFLAVLGWSPILRRLLELKRRSNHETDRADDGARAAFAEEGLSHILARMSDSRQGYRTLESVDGDTLNLFNIATAELEVNELPWWAWKLAIVRGFAVMHQLDENGGGVVRVDLDKRGLEYQKSE